MVDLQASNPVSLPLFGGHALPALAAIRMTLFGSHELPTLAFAQACLLSLPRDRALNRRIEPVMTHEFLKLAGDLLAQIKPHACPALVVWRQPSRMPRR